MISLATVGRSTVTVGTDAERRARVTAELRALAKGAPIPEVHLTNNAISRTRNRLPWRAASGVVISRRSIDAQAPDALRGEIAHEYAHLLDPQRWLYVATAIIVGLPGLGLMSIGIARGLGAAVSPDTFVAAFGLSVPCAAALLWCSRRGELRADALAAHMLGDPAPVLAMLSQTQAENDRHRWLWSAIGISHPSPRRRAHALESDARWVGRG